MGDIKVAETFIDCVFITDTATGAPALLLAPTCTFVKAANNTRTVGAVVELGSGWYKCTDFQNDAAGTWLTEWAVAGAFTIHYPYKEFKAGGGQTADIATTVTDIHDTDLPDVHTDVGTAITDIGAVHTHINDIHDTDLPDLHTDVGTCITAAGAAAAYAIVNSGQSFRGIVSNIPGPANQFKIATLAGIGAGVFVDANTPWYAYVLRDSGGLAAAPQGETRLITGYATADGTFTTAAFTSPVELNDDIIIMSAYLTATTTIDSILDDLHNTDIPDIHTDIGTAITAIGDVHATDLPDLHTDVGTVLTNLGDVHTDVGTAITNIGDIHATDLPDLHTDVGTAITNIGTVDTVVDAIKARTDNSETIKTFFSATDDIITCNTDSSDLTLPSVVLPNIAGTITHVYAGVKFRMIENTNAATNGLNGAQDIQVKESVAGAYVDAINLVDNQWLLAATTREGGDCAIGNIDVVGQVAAFNKTYNFIIDNNDVDQANLNLCDVQTFLIVSYY